jgi:hypothetical protein
MGRASNVVGGGFVLLSERVASVIVERLRASAESPWGLAGVILAGFLREGGGIRLESL